MAANIIADVKVTDPVAYEEYKALTPAAIAAHGGRFLARGGQSETLGGDWPANRTVILEFPDYATAKRFYDSDEYRKAREVRKNAANFKMMLVDGV